MEIVVYLVLMDTRDMKSFILDQCDRPLDRVCSLLVKEHTAREKQVIPPWFGVWSLASVSRNVPRKNKDKQREQFLDETISRNRWEFVLDPNFCGQHKYRRPPHADRRTGGNGPSDFRHRRDQRRPGLSQAEAKGRETEANVDPVNTQQGENGRV